jgi:hypothetical protein
MSDTPEVQPEQPIKVLPSKIVSKSSLKQVISVTLFVAGFGWFFYRLGEMFMAHSDWAFVRTPMGVGEMLQITGSAVMTISGALGVNVRDLFAPKKAKS